MQPWGNYDAVYNYSALKKARSDIYPISIQQNGSRIMNVNLLSRLIICLLLNLFAVSCIVVNGGERISGSGKIISEERDVPIFDQIHLKGSGKVNLTKAADHSVLVRTDDNIMPHIRTEVEDGRLIISHERKNIRPTVLTLQITAANLEGVSISGSGDIAGSDEFSSNRFFVDIAGSGDISVGVDTKHLESNISGSGSIYLSGSTDSYNSTITGSGDVDAFELLAKESSVVITGSGKCKISVSEYLRAKITGSGDVLYKGRPQISQSITGSGKVKDRN